MNFRKTSQGGGVISDPKNFVADFLGNFEGKNNDFSGKGVNFVADLCQRPFGSFLKIHQFLWAQASLTWGGWGQCLGILKMFSTGGA